MGQADRTDTSSKLLQNSAAVTKTTGCKWTTGCSGSVARLNWSGQQHNCNHRQRQLAAAVVADTKSLVCEVISASSRSSCVAATFLPRFLCVRPTTFLCVPPPTQADLTTGTRHKQPYSLTAHICLLTRHFNSHFPRVPGLASWERGLVV